MDAGQAWNNAPLGQWLQQKHVGEGLSWCSHRTLALQRQPGTGHSVTEKIREAEKSWVAQGVKEGKTKQVGVVGKRTNKCKKEISKRQGSLSLSPLDCGAKHTTRLLQALRYSFEWATNFKIHNKSYGSSFTYACIVVVAV